MNTIRMFAFVAAVLVTALLFRVLADGFTSEEQPARAATATHAAAVAAVPVSAAD